MENDQMKENRVIKLPSGSENVGCNDDLPLLQMFFPASLASQLGYHRMSRRYVSK